MVLPTLQQNVTGFTNGLNTETSVLTNLPSEFQDGSFNVDILPNGSIKPRRGVNALSSSTYTVQSSGVNGSSLRSTPNVHFAKFKISTSNTQQDYLLVQAIGTNKYITVYNTDITSLQSIGSPAFELSLGTNCASQMSYKSLSFASSDTRTYFTGLYCQPGYISLSTGTINPTITFFDVFTRNITGAATTSSRVQYNNKWYECAEAHTSAAQYAPDIYPEYWHQLTGSIPGGTATWSAASVSYTTNLVKTFSKAETLDGSQLRPTVIALHANRIWLALGSTLYFSQIIEDDVDTLRKGIRFYQAADPFSSTDNDVVEDDGGVLPIQGAGIITGLYPLGKSLFVTTTDGVYQVSGADGIFTATNYSVNRVLNDRIESKFGGVVVGETLIIAGVDALWISKREDTLFGSDSVSFEKLTEAVVSTQNDSRVIGIKTLYKSIPEASKKAMKVVYSSSDSTIYIFYNESLTSYDISKASASEPGYYTNWLKFNTITKTYTKHSIIDNAGSSKPYITCPFILPTGTDSSSQEVVSNSDNVVSNSNNVVISIPFGSPELLFLGAIHKQADDDLVYLFGEMESENVTDWAYDAAYEDDYDAKVYCGVQVFGDVSRRKSATYIFFVFKKVESGIIVDNVDTHPGGCLLSVANNFATSTTSKKWTNQLQIYYPYRFGVSLASGANDGHNHTHYKLKLKASGYATQFVIQKDPGKDFHLIGFNTDFFGHRDGRLYKQA